VATAVILLLFVLIATGMPLAFALGVVGAVGVWLFAGFGPDAVVPRYHAVQAAPPIYELMTIPMFVLMAEFSVIVSGVAEELFDAMDAWTRRVRGAWACRPSATGAMFSSICGPSAASAGNAGIPPPFRRCGGTVTISSWRRD